MTGIVLSVNGKTCIAIDGDGVVHKFKVHGEVLPGQTVSIPQPRITARVSVLTSFASLAVAALLVVFGVTSYRPAGTPVGVTQEIAYLDNGEVIIGDEGVPLAAVPESGGEALALICWGGAGILAICAVALLVKGVWNMRGKFRIRKALAFVMAVMLALGLLPLNALADNWITIMPGASDYVYYYGGTKNIPSPNNVVVSGPALNDQGVFVDKADQGVYVYQYVLNNAQKSDEAISTYCSDLAVQPQDITEDNAKTTQSDQASEFDRYMYNRTQIEELPSSIPDKFFFNATVDGKKLDLVTTAGRLRAILMNSDLWYNQPAGVDVTIEKLEQRANGKGFTVAGLTEDELMVATQLAVWHVVNGARPKFNSQATNVAKYYNYLIGLEGVPAEKMATLKPIGLKKTNFADEYHADVTFSVVGEGVIPGSPESVVTFDGAKPNSRVISVTYTENNGAPVPVHNNDDRIHYTVKDDTVTVNNIPRGAVVTVEATTATEVTSVYLYSTKDRRDSQTLVSVETGEIDLKTQVIVEASSNFAGLDLSKSWTSGGYPLSNNVASEHYAEFKFSYAKRTGDTTPDKFAEAEVAQFTITGNGYQPTGSIFEAGKFYKLEEISIDGNPVDNPTASYFTVKYDTVGQVYKVVWCEPDGTELPADQQNGHAFTNDVTFPQGSVSVSKTVTSNGNTGPVTDFTFTALYTAPGLIPSESTTKPLAKAEYIVVDKDGVESPAKFTDDNGMFTLKAGETATFAALPKDATLQIVETVPYSYDMSVVPTDGTQTVAVGDAPTEIKFTNTYLFGSLTINKTFAAGSLVDWSKFPAGAGIDFEITGTDEEGNLVYEETVILPKGETFVQVNGLPLGNYTVHEVTASDAENTANFPGYVLSVANDQTAAITLDERTANVSFTNNYARGSLEITKTVVIGNDIKDATDTASVAAKDKLDTAFTFKLYKDEVLFQVNGSDTFTVTAGSTSGVPGTPFVINNLEPGTYRLEEVGGSVDGIRHTMTGSVLTATIENGSTDKQTLSAVNIYAKTSATLSVTKTVVGGGSVASGETYTITATKDDNSISYDFVLNAGNNWTAEKTVIPGTYVIGEEEVTVTNYGKPTVEIKVDNVLTSEVTLNDGNSKAVTVTNTYTRQLGAVSFTKDAYGKAYGDTFAFAVTFSETPDDTQKAAITVTNGTKGTWSGSVLTISGVAEGKTVTISNIPTGVTVTVTESLTTDQKLYYAVAKYHLTDTTKSNLTGTVGNDNTVPLGTVYNERKEDINLKLNKTLTGANWGFFEQGIKFTITGPLDWGKDFLQADGTTPITGYDTFKKVSSTTSTSTYSIILKGNGTDAATKTFAGVPAGKYVISEDIATGSKTSANLAGYSRTTLYDFSTKTDINITNDPTVGTEVFYGGLNTITFKNKYDTQTGPGEFTKKFDYQPDPSERFIFTFEFSSTLGRDEMYTGIAVTGIDEVAKDDLPDAGSYWYWDSNYTLKLVLTGATLTDPTKNGKISLTGIPAGTSCKVTESPNANYQTIGAVTADVSDQGGTLILELENKHKLDATLKVSKTVDGLWDGEVFNFTIKAYAASGLESWTGSYTVYDSDDEEVRTVSQPTDGTFTLKDKEYAVFEGLPRNVLFQVEERYANAVYTTTVDGSTSKSAQIRVGDDSALAFTNTRGVGDLMIAKAALTGDALDLFADTEFTFVLERQRITSTSEEIWDAVRIDGMTNEYGEFALRGGESKSFTGLPIGNYRVTEKNDTIDSAYKWVVKNGDTDITSTKEISVTLTSAGESVTFTNDFTYNKSSLKVTKTVDADTAGWDIQFPARAFSFTLYKGGTDESNKYISDATPNGKFTLTAAEEYTKTFLGLTYDTYYVVEDNATEDGFNGPVVEYSLTDGKVVIDETKEYAINVSNTYTRPTDGSLTVSKTSNLGVAAKDYSFMLERHTDGTWKKVTGLTEAVNGVSMGNDGVFTLKAGAEVTITKLPLGDYRVKELSAEESGYKLVVTITPEAGVTLTTDEPASAISVDNAYTELFGDLTITKTIGVGSDPRATTAPEGWSYHFEIIGDIANWGSSQDRLTPDGSDNKRYTFTLSKGDAPFELAGIPIGNYTIKEIGGTGTDKTDYKWTLTIVGGTVVLADKSTTITVTDNSPAGHPAETVTFTNSFTRKSANFELTKNVDGNKNIAAAAAGETFTFEIEGPDDFTTGTDDNKTVTITAGVDGNTLEFGNAPSGTYFIRELEPPEIEDFAKAISSFSGNVTLVAEGEHKGWYTFTIDGTETGTMKIECTNYYAKDGAQLRVSKNVTGYSGSDKFTFNLYGTGITKGGLTFYLYDSEGDPIIDPESPEGATKTGDATYNSVKNCLVFTLEDGQTAVFKTDIEPSTTYTVTEELNGNRFAFVSAKAELYTYDGDAKPVTGEVRDTASAEEGKAPSVAAKTGSKTTAGAAPGVWFTFNNKRLEGEMSVEKTVSGQLYSDEAFTFTVTFRVGPTTTSGFVPITQKDFPNLAVLVDGIELSEPAMIINEAGELVFKLNAGKTAVVKGLPIGTYYSVAEDTTGDTDGDFYYKVEPANDSNMLVGAEPVKTTVKNTRSLGILFVQKIVFPEPALEDAGVTFPISVTFTNGIAWDAAEVAKLFTVSINGALQTIVPEISGDTLTLTFELAHLQEATIENVPVGCTYKIDEPELDTTQYKKWIKSMDGKVNAPLRDGSKGHTENDSIAVYNFRIPSDSLLITKEAIDAMPGSDLYNGDQKFEFILELWQPGAETEFYKQEVEKQLIIIADLIDELQTILNNSDISDEDINTYKQLVAALEMALSDYNAECERIHEHYNHLGSLIDCLTCEGTGTGEGECGTCFGTGIETDVPCECGGENPEECPLGLCDGNGLIPEIVCRTCNGVAPDDGCEPCGGTGKVVDQVNLDIELGGAQSAYDTTVGLLNADLAAMDPDIELVADNMALLEKFNDIYGLLYGGTYVEFDPITGEFEADEERNHETFDIDIDTQFKAYDKTPSNPINVEVTKTETGAYRFFLGVGEILEVTGLPAGTTYTVTEKRPTGLDGEPFDSATVESLNTDDISGVDKEGGTWLSGTVRLSKEEVEVGEVTSKDGNYIAFTNKYAWPKGSLKITKIWVGITANEDTPAITVRVYEDGTNAFVGEVTLSHGVDGSGWSARIDGLDLNKSYYVVEVNRPALFGVSYNYGDAEARSIELVYTDRNGEVSVTNTYNPPPPPTPDIPPPGDDPDIPPPGDDPVDPDNPPPEEEIPEIPVPLTDRPPDVNLPDDPVIIDEPDVPLIDVPKTGDTKGLAGFMFLGALSGAGIMIAAAKKKSKPDEA